MKKSLLLLLVCTFTIVSLTLTSCVADDNYIELDNPTTDTNGDSTDGTSDTQKNGAEDTYVHNYSSVWSYDDECHWHACTDEGYTHLKADESLHNLVEGDYDSSTGYTTYSCDCGYTKQYLRTTIISNPAVVDTVYIGQKLSDIPLTGGSGNVEGSFVWSSPSTVVTESGSYSVTFVPADTAYAPITTQIELTAVESLVIVTCLSGTSACYTFDGTTLTFTEISAESVYSVSGELNGNIVIDVGDTYKFDLEMHGFTLTSADVNPITVLSGDEISLKAKNGYENFIYDNRAAIDTADETLYSAAVYSLVDLELAGKGALTIISENNNGVHTKDDLQVKNLTLYVKCVDNALKGNDGVELTDANTTLIATGGDCIKTTNSHISETTENQKGTVYIAGGTHNLYAACDGVDAAYDAVVDESENVATVLNIYTDSYSSYTGDVTTTSQSSYYIKSSSNSYTYSVMYYNSSTGDSEWVNASTTYETVSSSSSSGGMGGGGQSRTYYYYTVAQKTGYDKIVVYMYTSSQTQGSSTNYYKCSEQKTINDSYDTIYVSTSSNKGQSSSSSSSSTLSVSWEVYSSSGTSYSTKGLKAANAITINGGTITVLAYDDAIHANNDGGTLENGSEPVGNVTVNGGTVTVTSKDDGIHADGTLAIAGGTVNVLTAYEGIEAPTIVFSGGNTTVYSTDDAVNASGDSPTITVTGGYIDLTTPSGDTDTLDSNGSITMTGGTLVIKNGQSGTSQTGGTMDCDGQATFSGGTVISCGAINMEVGYISDSVYNTSTTLSAGEYTIQDSSGNVIVEFTLGSSYTAYMFYSDLFVSGTTYYVYRDGSQALTFTK